MKLLIITLTTLLSLVSLKSNADEINVTPQVLKSFTTSFNNATEVKWSANSMLFKAEFSYHGQFITAYYNADGEMVAATKNISSTTLPVAVQASLKKVSKGYWIADLFELTDDSGTSYYVTLENADTKVVLKNSIGTTWTTYLKQVKS
jgi:hypothetical protein